MDPAEATLRSVLVWGGGLAGWSAAAALGQALPTTRIVLVETPDDGNLCDAMGSAPPSIHSFNEGIGIEQPAMAQHALATPWLSTRIGTGPGAWTFAFGAHGAPAPAARFHQHWLRVAPPGSAWHDTSLAARRAAAGLQGAMSADGGLRYAHESYLRGLRTRAQGVGVERAAGALAGVLRSSSGAIERVQLQDGREFVADLYVDCGGSAAPLLSQVEQDFEDWSAWLPGGLCAWALDARACAAAAQDSAQPLAEGWLLASPGRDGLRRVLACERSLPAEQVARLLGAAPSGQLAWRAGRRRRAFVHNVLALGDAAAMTGVLLGAPAQLLHHSLRLALQLLPGRTLPSRLLAEYNRRVALAHEGVRDFQALVQRAAVPATGARWDALRVSPPPASLAHRLEQFKRRGAVPYYPDGLVDEEAWVAALLGSGLRPAALDPAVHACTPGESRALVDAHEQRLRRMVGATLPLAPQREPTT